MDNFSTYIYICLTLISSVPLLFGFKPVTFYLSKRSYPKAISNSEQFININKIITLLWSLIFLISATLSNINYNLFLKISLPITIQLMIGLPLTLILPNYLKGILPGSPKHFKTIKELFEVLPYGLNKKKSKDLEIVIQFNLTGREETTGYLEIFKSRCRYSDGMHPSPSISINSDSKLWLMISNGEISGERAYIENKYSIEGDESILLEMNELFSSTTHLKKDKEANQDSSNEDYYRLTEKQIKKIAVFDGGYRDNKFSKTSFMVKSFLKGVSEFNVDVEYIKLKNYNIKECNGCFMCWTKTPGICIHKDDMPELLNLYREADLIIFASPLYTFSVTGILKTFMDRLLPLVEPYMKISDKGKTLHPDRYPHTGHKGFLVFSACGFDDIQNNFDGLRAMFRCWDSHSEYYHLMGEFLLPCGEVLSQPVYKKVKNRIEELCYSAGKMIINEGFINKEIMDDIKGRTIRKEVFKEQSDFFWDSLVNKRAYLKVAPRIN